MIYSKIPIDGYSQNFFLLKIRPKNMVNRPKMIRINAVVVKPMLAMNTGIIPLGSGLGAKTPDNKI